MHHLLLTVRCVILPPIEPARKWMLQMIQNKLTSPSDSLSLLNVVFPRVQRLRQHIIAGVFEEKSNYAFLHVVLLHTHLIADVFFDGFG